MHIFIDLNVIIISFVTRIRNDKIFNNSDSFIAKLPYCCGGQLQGKRITCKSATGVKGIIDSIEEFLNNSTVRGYIQYCIIQPRVKDNTEAKVSCSVAVNFAVESLLLTISIYSFFVAGCLLRGQISLSQSSQRRQRVREVQPRWS